MRNCLSNCLKFLSIFFTVALLVVLGAIYPAHAQFDDGAGSGGTADGAKGSGPVLGEPLTKKIKIGVKIRAVGGPCKGIVATVPVPIDWPEQKIKPGDEDLSHGVQHVSYRNLEPGGVKQMIITVPNLPAGEEAHALVSFEITRYDLAPPEDTTIYKECAKEKLPKNVLPYLGPSPYIESTHPKIIALAKEAAEDKTGWEKVEALYDIVREKVKYQNGALKGALKALNDGTGDCEELTSLFVALCRASGIPARSVWVPEHSYPEFYLVDGSGKGYWFPCEPTGSAKIFGGNPEHRPVLQKGDNFHDPDRPQEKLRYVSEFLKGSGAKGAGRPQVEFVREWE